MDLIKNIFSNNRPTIFHVTHVKAGSQWVYGILEACAQERIVRPKVKAAHFFTDPILPGQIYPAVYASRDQFENILYDNAGHDVVTPSFTSEATLVQNRHNFQTLKKPTRVFFVIRDFRDTLVSLYFSLKISHTPVSDTVTESRLKLNEFQSHEDGLIYLLERGRSIANIQRTWMQPDFPQSMLLIRYEDLIANQIEEFQKIIDHCQISIPRAKLAEIVRNNSFETQAGRSPGEEDIHSHYRKGISGDWKNYFTDKVKEQFKQKFSTILIETGYEKDLAW